MGYTAKLYHEVLRVTFWKAKDTKWIIFMAAFVITMISMLFAVGESIETSFLEAIHNTSRYDVNIGDLGYVEASGYIADFQKEDLVSYAALTTDNFVLSVPDSYFYVNCIGIEGDYEEIYQFEICEGNYPRNAEEIVLDRKFNQIFGQQYQIGDEVAFEMYSPAAEQYQTISYRISGFFEVSHSGEYDLYGFVNMDGGNRAFHQMAEEVDYNMLMKAKEDTSDAVEQLVQNLDNRVDQTPIINLLRYEMLLEKESDTNSFIVGFKGLGIFIVIVSVALLFNMFQVATVNKIQQLGILRSIGMNKKQLVKAMIMNLCLYLLSSMLLGFVMFMAAEKIFGKLLMHLFMDSFTQSLQYVDVQWHFNIFAFIGCALLIFVIMAVVYGSIIVKVMRLTPLEAVYYRDETVGKVGRKTYSKRKESFTAFVGKRNLSRNRLRTMYTGFTLGIMSVLFVSIMTILGNVDFYDIDAMRKSKMYDYEFYEDMLVSSIDNKIIGEIADLESVDNVCGARRVVYEFFQEEAAVVNSDTVVETRVYGEEVYTRICEENDIEYSLLPDKPMFFLLSDEEVMTDSVSLYDKDHRLYEIKIDAVIARDNYCGAKPVGKAICLIMNEAAAQVLLGEYNYNVLLVNANQKVQCRSEVCALLKNQGISVYYEDLKMNTEDARAQLQSIVYIAGYLLVCFGVMVVANIICNININVNLRTQEYGMLLAIGMNRRQVVQLMIYEIMYVMEKALLLATPFALIISAFFISGLGQEINIIKMLIISCVSSLFLYAVTYGISYVKGSQKFRKNIMQLMWDR